MAPKLSCILNQNFRFQIKMIRIRLKQTNRIFKQLYVILIQEINQRFWVFLILNPQPKICALILERQGGKESDRERNTDVRNINQLPPVHTPTRDQTCNLGHVHRPRIKYRNLLVYRMTLQPLSHPARTNQKLL